MNEVITKSTHKAKIWKSKISALEMYAANTFLQGIADYSQETICFYH